MCLIWSSRKKVDFNICALTFITPLGIKNIFLRKSQGFLTEKVKLRLFN